jgi:ankyrin repeat protein/serine/threonine protein kinase
MMQPEMLAALGGEDNKGEKDWAKVLELITARPDAAKEKSECHGAIPLWYAAEREAPFDVFKTIFDMYPDGAKQADKYRNLPLHYAETADTTRLLLEAYPDGVKQMGQFGFLPLHKAKTADIARVLVKAYPDGVKESGLYGFLPLHYAETIDIARLLLEAYPDSAKQADKDGRLPLHYAKTADIARLLLEAYPDGAKQANKYGKLPLHRARTADIARLLLEAYPEGVKEADKEGRLPLHCAETADIARLLLEAYPDGVKQTIKYGLLPLHYGVENKLPDIARLLLEAYPEGAKQTSQSGNLPLHRAKTADIAHLLLEAYPEGAKEADKEGKLPLHIAVKKNRPDIARLLLEAYPEGAKEADKEGKLPLHYAVENKLPDIAHLLLEAYPEGAKQVDDSGELPLLFAVRNKLPEIARLLLEAYPEGAKQTSKFGSLPLHIAVMNKLPDIARLLLEAYPDSAKQADKDGRLPLHYAETADIARLLLEAYPDGAKQVDDSGELPLHEAKTADIARLLLEAYPDGAKAKDKYNKVLPLHHAVKKNRLDIARLLLESYPDGAKQAGEYGKQLPLYDAETADIARLLLEAYPDGAKQTSRNGNLPLHIAIEKNLPDIARLLLEAYPEGAKQADNYWKRLPLHAAIVKNLPDIARLLLEAYPDGTKAKDKYRSLPLHYAKTADIVRLLLEAYPDGVNQTSKSGKLPLHYAVENKLPDIVRLLLEAYPDGVKQTNDGSLPLHIAIKKNQPDIARLLLEAYPDAASIADKGRLPLQRIAEMKHRDQEEHLELCQLVYNATSPDVRDVRHLDRKGICLASPISYVHEWALRLGTRYQHYNVESPYPVHQSATSVVWFATDVVNNAPVALKLMKNYDEFAREILTRFGDKPVDTCVTKVVGWHLPDGAQSPLEHPMQRETATEPDFFPEKPYVLVMERGSTSLWHEIGTRRIGGYRPVIVRQIFIDAVVKVQALHNLGLIHSDLKPRNFLRIDGALMLCDMDAALEIGKERAQDMKCSTAYCPPELAQHIFAGGPTIKNIDAAFDVWSLGVILYELCTGQHLFSQDISDDNLVDKNDQVILCAWHTIPDSYLEGVFPGQDGQHAKDLIRWCLKGNPSERPNIENILAHPFCDPSAPTVSLRPMKYHAFLSHAQGDASGTAATLYSLHKALGVHLWYDMRATQLNLDGMKQGVRDSDIIVIVLTRTTLSRWFCRQEILEAVASNRRIQLILEEDSRFNPFDLELWRKAKMVYDCDNKAFNETTPDWSVIVKAIDDHLDDAVPFRRRAYEQDGMMRAICQRCEWKIPPKPACVNTSKEFTIFAICNTSTIFQELRDGISGKLPGVRLTADTAELSGAKYVLVVLTKGVIVDHEVLLMQAIQEDKTNRVDRLVFVKKEPLFDGIKQHDAWEFGSEEQKRVSDINMAVNAHEALPYRPKVVSGSRYRHEYSLMVEELLEMFMVWYYTWVQYCKAY